MIDRADPVLRDFLKASGFGFTAYQSGAPAGYFPATDDAARADVIARLEAHLRGFDFADADLGGFDVAAFLKAVADARPLPTDDIAHRPHVGPMAARALPEPDFLATHIGFAKLSGRNRIMPLMVLSLAITLGVYLVIQRIGAAPVP